MKFNLLNVKTESGINTKLLILTAIVIAALLTGCAGKQSYSAECAIQLRAAAEQLNIAEAKGLAGLNSYIEASGLLVTSSAMQGGQDFYACVTSAKEARGNIAQALLGE
jgi:hypothetical protein